MMAIQEIIHLMVIISPETREIMEYPMKIKMAMELPTEDQIRTFHHLEMAMDRKEVAQLEQSEQEIPNL